MIFPQLNKELILILCFLCIKYKDQILPVNVTLWLNENL